MSSKNLKDWTFKSVTSLTNNSFQTDFQSFPYCTKTYQNRNTSDLNWHHQPLKDESEID